MVHQFQYDVFSRGRVGAGIQTYVNINPPLWFMEGMAEFLSVGPIDNHTAMWLRDASVEGHLPTLQQLSYDEVFPYYFGHAIWAYVGEKWGDDAVGQILQASTSAGVEGAFKRVIGVNLDELISGWRDAVQTTYLPQLADHYRARRIAQPLLTRKRSDGTLHIAPALDRKSTRLNSSHSQISYAVFCLIKKNTLPNRDYLGTVSNTGTTELAALHSEPSLYHPIHHTCAHPYLLAYRHT